MPTRLEAQHCLPPQAASRIEPQKASIPEPEPAIHSAPRSELGTGDTKGGPWIPHQVHVL